eukprot:487967_1
MANSDTVNTVIICFVTQVIFVYLPLITVHLRNYYIYRDNVALKKRYSFITVLEILILYIYLLVNCSVNIILVFNGNTNSIEFTLKTINSICYIIIFSFWLWKLWMIRYDIKHTFSIKNQQWMHIINQNMIQLQNNFYLTKKHTLGNTIWIRNHFIIPLNVIWIITIETFNYLIINTDNNSLTWAYIIVWLSWILFTELILLFIYFSTPKFRDAFIITLELKRLVIIIQLYVCHQIFTIISYKYISYVIMQQINYFIQQTILIVICVLCEWWTIVRLRSKRIISKYKNRTRYSDDVRSTLLPTHDNVQNKNGIKYCQLRHVFKRNDLLDMFMGYLSIELSNEFLLCFIEIIQFQQRILKLPDINIDDSIEYLCQYIKLYPNIVKSNIVFGNNGYSQDQLLIKSNQLFEKYIEYGSKYQILLTKGKYKEIYGMRNALK